MNVHILLRYECAYTTFPSLLQIEYLTSQSYQMLL